MLVDFAARASGFVGVPKDGCVLTCSTDTCHNTCCILDRQYADSANYLYIHYDTSMYVFEVQALHVESPMMRKESFFPKKLRKHVLLQNSFFRRYRFLNTPKKTGIL